MDFENLYLYQNNSDLIDKTQNTVSLNQYLTNFQKNQNVSAISITNNNLTNRSTTTITDTTSPDINESNNLLRDAQINSRLKYLEEELQNAQADKEFVWSLWRQLQSTNPDLTSAIGLVVQREKEKNEAKDRKVLEILHNKDLKISELTESYSNKKSEFNRLSERLKTLEMEIMNKNEEIDLFKLNAKTFEDKIQMYEQILRNKDDKYDKLSKDSESEKQQLVGKIRDLVNELAKQEEDELKIKIECEQHKQKTDLLNQQVKHANDNYEKLLEELNQFRDCIDTKLKSENEKLRENLKVKKENNEKLRSELDELWVKFNQNVEYVGQQDKLIKQLKQNQADLQETIKSQQGSFECENDKLKAMYDQLAKKYEKLITEESCSNEAKLVNQQQLKFQMQQAKINEKSTSELVKAQQYEIEQLKLELDLQKQQIEDKRLLCDELTNQIEDYERFFNEKQKPELKRSESSKSLQRSKSVTSRNGSEFISSRLRSKSTDLIDNDDELRSDDEAIENDLDENKDSKTDKTSEKLQRLKSFYENLCKTKDKRFEMLKKSHQRRLEVCLNLEKELKLVKEELDFYKDSENKLEKNPYPKRSTNEKLKSGYTRKDPETLNKEIKVLKTDNTQLKEELERLKEKFESKELKLQEQNELLQRLNIDFSVNFLKGKEQKNKMKSCMTNYERDLQSYIDKSKQSQLEISQLKSKINDLNQKCLGLINDRIKYVDLSTKLTTENKKLHKKWFKLRKNENKFRLLLVEQMNKHSQAKIKRKVSTKSDKNFGNLFNSILSAKTEQSNNYKVQPSFKLKCFQLEKDNLMIRKQNEQLQLDRNDKEAKLKKLITENEKLSKDIKQIKSQAESYSIEISGLRKRESEVKDKEEAQRKQNESQKEEIKKSFDLKIRQLSGDLTKQINSNKTLKQELESISGKLKINEEKLNHSERDINQKKQLIEFYKKKIEEFNLKEKNDVLNSLNSNSISNEMYAELKQVNDKLKSEVKLLKTKIETVQNEKLSAELKINQKEKELNETIENLKKDKTKLENNIKKLKVKINELECYRESLENTAETNIKILSDQTQETLLIAQHQIKTAQKSAKNFEMIIKYLYESLVDRHVHLKRTIETESKKLKLNKTAESRDVTCNDENFKMAMSLASNLLNITTDELDNLMSGNSDPTNDSECRDYKYKRLAKKMLNEFEQYLNVNKKEKVADFNADDTSPTNNNQIICELLSKQLNDVLDCERELAFIKKNNA